MKRSESYFKKNITTMIKLMQKQSPEHHFEFRDPFWVLITTILSHRTKDEVTDRAARSLEEKYHDCNGLSEASYNDVLSIIDKVGFKTVKAERVINAAKILREQYNCKVPEDIDLMMKIPGVGRKTANVVLSDAFGIPAIAVDTHVQRICYRTGISNSQDPEETEIILQRIVPKELWVGLNPMMVEFGKNICRPVGPKCQICNIRDYCNFGEKSLKDRKK
ncbi:endonuclease III domain-containing protein [Cuniculiplasma sp. SKW3]|uniref:endonuclease III domain-containing protein n=1 Tax=Cuniculiplasma sp. SKW3 TaxID=3400170 RepID=UPI003FD2597D